MPYGSFASFCNIGTAKHAVFPLPVCAHPITCVPGFNECCRLCSWMIVGLTILIVSKLLIIHWLTFSSLNDLVPNLICYYCGTLSSEGSSSEFEPAELELSPELEFLLDSSLCSMYSSFSYSPDSISYSPYSSSYWLISLYRADDSDSECGTATNLPFVWSLLLFDAFIFFVLSKFDLF